MLPSFNQMFSLESLFASFLEFRKGKKSKSDVAEFSIHLMSNLSRLHDDLISGSYRHGGYAHFIVADPKSRDIHKASVRDRVVHHALYRALYPYFDCLFIHDSYSCRLAKGTHRALDRFQTFAGRASKNDTQTAWVLSCDIRKCFASVDHGVLKHILEQHVSCARTRAVLCDVIDSFSSNTSGVGIPLGNLTSQLFINIYMNELDQYIKRDLKAEYYLRYADDFILVSCDRTKLLSLIAPIRKFLVSRLQLELHPKKVSINTIASGVDVLGWVHFPHHRVLRTATKKRMLRSIARDASPESITSYQGMLRHGNGHKLVLVLRDPSTRVIV